MLTQPILIAKAVVKRYGSFAAVDGVNLEVARKGVHSLIGPNGAGKTTFFHVLSGVVTPSSGSVIMEGQDISKAGAHTRAELGIGRSFQVTSLFLPLTVEENLRLAIQGRREREAMRFWGRHKIHSADSDFIDQLLQRVNLNNLRRRIVSELSHGEQRRLEVSMALACKPKIILLDEPTSGMGIDDIEMMRQIIRKLGNDFGILLIEHNMSIVMSISDKITVMAAGRILTQGKPDEIRKNELVRSAYLGGIAE